jgi:hypothetical protein
MKEMNEHICNLCGLTCILNDRCRDYGCEHGLLDVQVQGGYESTPGNGSGALDDTTFYTFSLCEFCLDWLFQQFKNPPKVYSGWELEVWRSALDRVNQDDWRTYKDEFFVEYERHNKARNQK